MEPKLYRTTYPRLHWCWFDVTVFGGFPPTTGNLKRCLFEKLKGGILLGGYRSYASEAEAMDDLAQATN